MDAKPIGELLQSRDCLLMQWVGLKTNDSRLLGLGIIGTPALLHFDAGHLVIAILVNMLGNDDFWKAVHVSERCPDTTRLGRFRKSLMDDLARCSGCLVSSTVGILVNGSLLATNLPLDACALCSNMGADVSGKLVLRAKESLSS